MIQNLILTNTTGWDVGSFLERATETLGTWGALFVGLIGVAMLIAGVWQIAKGLMSHGRTQTNWAIAILLIIVGGAFAFGGGWGLVTDIAKGGEKTIRDMGQVIHFLRFIGQ